MSLVNADAQQSPDAQPVDAQPWPQTLISPTTVMNAQRLAASRRHCKRVARRQARNFYYGMKLTPEPKRSANYAIYTWMRMADDIADEPDTTENRNARIAAFQATTAAALAPADAQGEIAMPTGRIWPALRKAVYDHDIPRQYLQDMIDGMMLDQHIQRYQSFEQLYDYCYKVASVVGLTCIEIWDYEGGAQTRKLAEWRGIAFQLTNILRDVYEDAQADRVYLPGAMMDVEHIEPAWIFDSAYRERLLEVIRMVALRAQQYYEQSAALDTLVHPDGRACLWAMTRIYHDLLQKILHNPQRVLSGERVKLSAWRKAAIAWRASIWMRLLHGR